MKAVRIHEPGGVEVLRYEDVPDPVAGPGQAVVTITVIGVNFGDTAQRSRNYRGQPLPQTIGIEAVGVVTSVGAGVTEVQPGQRVAIAGEPGAYAEQAAVNASRLIPIPAQLDDKRAAAVLMQGRTAHYLALDACPIHAGDKVLIHAGAGGVGSLLIQIAKRRGAYVFTTVSSAEKARFAADLGADYVINYVEQDFEAVIGEATGGEGVQAVYDAVGKTTFEGSFRSLARKGHLVMYGQGSGPPPPLDFERMRARGSFHVSSHAGADYRQTREELFGRTDDLFRWLREGELRLHISKEYPLSAAAQAHHDIESRGTIGKLLLIPEP